MCLALALAELNISSSTFRFVCLENTWISITDWFFHQPYNKKTQSHIFLCFILKYSANLAQVVRILCLNPNTPTVLQNALVGCCLSGNLRISPLLCHCFLQHVLLDAHNLCKHRHRVRSARQGFLHRKVERERVTFVVSPRVLK